MVTGIDQAIANVVTVVAKPRNRSLTYTSAEGFSCKPISGADDMGMRRCYQ